MRTANEHLIEAIANRPWAIDPETFHEVVVWLRNNPRGETPAPVAATRPTARSGAVAILPLRGVISQHMDLMAFLFGGTSTELFARAFRAALQDDAVKAIVIDVDSPGGSAFGVEELAREILGSRGLKPIVAVANPFMASAAYHIGAAADELVVSPSGMAGSVGILWMHQDVTKMAESLGIKVTLLSAGEFKTEGHPLEPLTDEAREYVQGQINQYYSLMVNTIAKGRGVPADQVRDGFGKGRMLTAKDAVKAGMADRVATFDQVLAKLGAARPSGGTGSPGSRTVSRERAARLWDIALMAQGNGYAAATPGPNDFKGTPFADLPVDEEEDWNPNGIRDSELMRAILGPNGDNWKAYKQANLAYAPGEAFGGDPPTQYNAYRLKVARRYPAGDPKGTLKVNFKQLANRVAVINGARGGVDISRKAKREAYEHAAKYYRKVGREPPPFKGEAELWSPESFAEAFRAEGRRNAASDQERIQQIHNLAVECGATCETSDEV